MVLNLKYELLIDLGLLISKVKVKSLFSSVQIIKLILQIFGLSKNKSVSLINLIKFNSEKEIYEFLPSALKK